MHNEKSMVHGMKSHTQWKSKSYIVPYCPAHSISITTYRTLRGQDQKKSVL